MNGAELAVTLRRGPTDPTIPKTVDQLTPGGKMPTEDEARQSLGLPGTA